MLPYLHAWLQLIGSVHHCTQLPYVSEKIESVNPSELISSQDWKNKIITCKALPCYWWYIKRRKAVFHCQKIKWWERRMSQDTLLTSPTNAISLTGSSNVLNWNRDRLVTALPSNLLQSHILIDLSFDAEIKNWRWILMKFKHIHFWEGK